MPDDFDKGCDRLAERLYEGGVTLTGSRTWVQEDLASDPGLRALWEYAAQAVRRGARPYKAQAALRAFAEGQPE